MEEIIRKAIELKLDKKTFWIILIPLISLVIGSVGNLYILYYSGLSDIQVNIAEIKKDIQYIQEDLKDYKCALDAL